MVSGKYAEDYRIDYIVGRNGKKKKQPVYIGALYQWELQAEELRRLKLLYLGVALTGWGLFIGSLWFYSELAKLWYVTVPYSITLFPLLFLSMAVCNMLIVKRPYTREKKEKTIDRLQRWPIVGIATCGIAAAGQVYGSMQLQALKAADIFLIAAIWLVLLIMVLLLRLSRSLKMQEIQGSD